MIGVWKDGAQTQETQFNKYQNSGGGWMLPEVIFNIDGKTVTREEYSDCAPNVKLDTSYSIRNTWATHSFGTNDSQVSSFKLSTRVGRSPLVIIREEIDLIGYLTETRNL